MSTVRHNTATRLALLSGAVLWFAACMGICGCKAVGFLGYVVTPPPPPKKVPAEFTGLENRRVAVVIFADERVQYEYPYARLTLSAVIRAEMNANLKGVSVIDPAKVCKFQDEHIHWEAMEKSELAKVFGVDDVLYVTLVEYTAREPGSVNLYRGRITAECSVYQAGLPDQEARVWHCDQIAVLYPKAEPTGMPGPSERGVREGVERLFAETLVKKFYEHKVPAE